MTLQPPRVTGVSDTPLDSGHRSATPDTQVESGDRGAALEWAPPPAPIELPRSQLRRFRPKTLTGRLVAFVVALVLAVVLVVGGATYALLSPFLKDRFDTQLSSVVSGNANSIQQCVAAQQNCSLGLVSGSQGAIPSTLDEWFVGYTTDGSVAFSTTGGVPHLRNLQLSSADLARVLSNPSHARTVTTLDGRRLRIGGELIDTKAGTFIIVTGLSPDETDHTLARLLVLEVLIGAGAVVVAAGVTAWGVRVGLRPLHRVTRTAQEVTAELGPDGAGLERRVPDADPDTEVGQVASSVNTLLGAVQNEFAARLRSEDRMRQFLADASHELRTPLTSIRGYAELSRLQGLSSNDPDDPMRRIEVEGTRMSRLVEDLLVLARGDDHSNELRRDPVDVDSVLADALRSAQSAHPDRTVRLVPSGGAEVIGDRDQLLRLLINLLNNAAVHTAPGGPITLAGVRGSTPAGRAVALQVIDAGPGLPPDQAAHVFERFWRADKARSRAKGGSGLGMAIVAQIVDVHGGTIDFQSSVADGTTVTVTLPLARSDEGRG